MSIIFSSNFDSSLSDWNLHTPPTIIPLWGCSRTKCFTCDNSGAGGEANLLIPLMEMTFRFQYAIAVGSTIPTPTTRSDGMLQIGPINNPGSYTAWGINNNGSMWTVEHPAPSGSFNIVNSFASGLFPIDGFYHGVQIGITITQLSSFSYSFTSRIYVDNSLKTTFSNIILADVNPLSPIQAFNIRNRSVSSPFILTAFDNVEVEDTNLITSFGACGALINNTTCHGGIPPEPEPSTLTGIYYIKTGKTNDTYYTNLTTSATTDVKIPDPFADTALLGDE